MKCIAYISSFIALCYNLSAIVKGEYTEELNLRSLPDVNKVLSHFHFTVNESNNDLIPPILYQLCTKYDVETLHLTFALGSYSEAAYGPMYTSLSPLQSLLSIPFGTTLQVKLNDLTQENVSRIQYNITSNEMKKWEGITSELGGLFSASLSHMDKTIVSKPLTCPASLNFISSYSTQKATESGVYLHGNLAREELCTENLTPWLKILPCRSISGLGKLIDPIRFLSGEYISLSLYIRRDSISGEWTMHQHLTSVHKLEKGDATTWSLSSLYYGDERHEQMSLEACPLAKRSSINTEVFFASNMKQVENDNSAVAERLQLVPDHTHEYENSIVYVINLLKQGQMEISEPWFNPQSLDAKRTRDLEHSRQKQRNTKDIVSVHRYVSGYGQVHGGFTIRLDNRHTKQNVRVTYEDIIPWYLRIYFHTMDVTMGKKEKNSTYSQLGKAEVQEFIHDYQFRPSELGDRPNQIYFDMTIPPMHTSWVSVEFDKVFLPLSAHPPDANRGFDISPGIATFVFPGSQYRRMLYTTPMLVALPTPDFSMPYNVIMITSTVVAFFVGSMLNTLVRKPPRLAKLLSTDETTKVK